MTYDRSGANNPAFKHGRSCRGKRTRLNSIWIQMRDRCNNQNHPFFHRYGGRGIAICREWDDFLEFERWAMQSGYKPGLTLDRENINEGYCPENCRWLTRSENIRLGQADRKREKRGGVIRDIETIVKIKTEIASGRKQADIARELGISTGEVSRIARGERWFDIKPELTIKPRQFQKLSSNDVIAIRRQIASGAKLADLARQYGVDPSTISGIKIGRTRADVT